MTNFKEVIKMYQNFSQRKAEAEHDLQVEIQQYLKKFSGTGAQEHIDSLTASFHSKYKKEFDSLGVRLNKLLDQQRNEITAPYSQHSADYELKLSNTLNMLSMLNVKDIQDNMAELKKAVRPFSQDSLAKKAILAVLAKNSASPLQTFDLFDNHEQFILEKIETARKFTNDSAYENQFIADDMERFLGMYFPDTQGEGTEQTFNFNFHPANAIKESFWQQ